MATRAFIIASGFVEDPDPSKVTVSIVGSILGPRPQGGPIFACLAEGVNPAAALSQKSTAIQAQVKTYLTTQRGVTFNAGDTVDWFVSIT